VPLILGYLDAERYGIWLTLSSILAWFSFFDIGLGNGLRNGLTEAIALKDDNLAKTYVSTTYAILGVIFLLVTVLFSIINPFLNWQTILNTTAVEKNELSIIALIVFIFFLFSFFFKLIGTILLADQKPAINNAFSPIGNVMSLLIIFILTKTTVGSLILLSFVLSSVPLLILILATIYFFRSDYKKYKPEFRYIDFTKSKDLLGLGFKFFFVQLASIIFFSTTNFLIAQFSNQETVASYNVAYKYLYMVNMIYAIVLTPFWSAVTDAFSREDYAWLKRSLRKLNILSGVMTIILFGALFISPYVYKLWIGEKLIIPFSLSMVITLYLIQQLFIAPFSTFINGIGKLRLGVYVLTIKLLVFIPLAYVMGQNYEAKGVILSMFIIQIPSLFLEPIQVLKLLNEKATGIWNK